MRKVSEKSLELNVNENLVNHVRKRYPKAFIYGFTVRGEGLHGLDSSIEVAPGTKFYFGLQFKKPQRKSGKKYIFMINNNRRRDQHAKLVLTALLLGPNRIFYAFPLYLTVNELYQDSPNFLSKTRLVDVLSIKNIDNNSHYVHIEHGTLEIEIRSQSLKIPSLPGEKFLEIIDKITPLDTQEIRRKIQKITIDDIRRLCKQHGIDFNALLRVLGNRRWISIIRSGYFV